MDSYEIHMKTVPCPQCGKPALFAPENKYRPFCSERCSTLDLGAWADEKYAVPAFEQDSETVNENDNDESTQREEIPPKDRRN
jgi:endogenous inhibitor of DNA gyrase (YacG/DUF329 family)